MLVVVDAPVWGSLAHVMRSGSSSRAFMYSAAISASAADDTTIFIIFAMIDIGPLMICCLLKLLPKYVYPAARDLAPVATKYAASKWLCSIMLLAL